ncbi:MAG: GMC family oxidoreductase [Archangiaceae bacterium]|nr:GMC family oxidoreductase [Archangiaceae bacterium]
MRSPGAPVSEPEVYDAVVVGSGAAGGWAALKLTRAGLKVAVIEAGRKLDPARDFTDHTPSSQLPLRGKALPKTVREGNPVQSQSYAFTEHTHQFFVSDKDQPYGTPADRPFTWIRARQVGGRTQTWGRVSLRFSDLDFKAARRDGQGIDWPLSYAELKPYYDEVERFVGVSGQAEGLPQLPDGRFLPPMKLSCGEQLLRKAVKKKFGRTLTIARAAVLTQDLEGRAKCHYCGPCERGCVTGSYFSSPVSTLAAAAKTGNLTLLPDTVVSHVTESDDGRARGVMCLGADGQSFEVRGRTVVLCASTLESTRILLASTSTRFPDGLGNRSGVLGHYLMDHVGASVAMSVVPSLRGVKDSSGERPTTFYIPRFQNLKGGGRDFLRGYGFQGASHDCGPGSAFVSKGIGAGFKSALKAPTPEWYVWLVGFGECLPRAENQVKLSRTLKDRHGLPSLDIDMRYGDNESAMVKHMAVSAAEMLATIGAEAAGPYAGPPGSSVHETGTARMGRDPKTSFLNAFNQSHEVKNLFVMDGAAFPSSPCQNPTLTIMALAARASDHLVSELKKKNL